MDVEVVKSNHVQEDEKSSLLSNSDLEIKASLDMMALVVIEETEVKLTLEEVVDALSSKKNALLTSMQVKVVGLEIIKDPKVRVKGIKMLHEGLRTKEKYAKCVEQTNKHILLHELEVEDMV